MRTRDLVYRLLEFDSKTTVANLTLVNRKVAESKKTTYARIIILRGSVGKSWEHSDVAVLC